MTGTEPVTYQLALPSAPPDPTPGCVVCETLVERRARAQQDGDFSGVSDCNVRLRRHEHRAAPIPR